MITWNLNMAWWRSSSTKALGMTMRAGGHTLTRHILDMAAPRGLLNSHIMRHHKARPRKALAGLWRRTCWPYWLNLVGQHDLWGTEAWSPSQL